jgi:hypothetical protein
MTNTFFSFLLQKSYKTVQICWNILLFLFIAHFILFVASILSRASLVVDWYEGLNGLFRLYCIWVIYAYKEEISRGADFGATTNSNGIRARCDGDFERIDI